MRAPEMSPPAGAGVGSRPSGFEPADSPREQADVAQQRAAALEDEDGRAPRAHAQRHPRRHVHLGSQLQEAPQGAARPDAGGVARLPGPTQQGPALDTPPGAAGAPRSRWVALPVG